MTFSCFVFKLIQIHACFWSYCIFSLHGAWVGRPGEHRPCRGEASGWPRSVCPAEGGLPAPTTAARGSRTDTAQPGHLLGRNGSWGGQRLEADSVVQVLTGSRGPYFGAGEWTTGRRPRSWSQPGPQPAGRPVTGQGWARECDEKGTHRPVMSSRAPGPSFLCSVLQPPAAAGPTSPRGRPAPDHGPRGRPGHLLAV